MEIDIYVDPDYFSAFESWLKKEIRSQTCFAFLVNEFSDSAKLEPYREVNDFQSI